MIINEDDYLEHYGTPRHSGRYPWGSGGNVGTPRNQSFVDVVKDLRRKGMTDPEICTALGIVNERTGKPSTTTLRAKMTIARNAQKQEEIIQAERLRIKGMSNVEIGKRMGRGESYVRTLLAPGAKERADNLTSVANLLKSEVEAKKYIDVGSGVEKLVDKRLDVNIGDGVSNRIGVSQTKLNTAVAMLKEEGYKVHNVKELQPGTGFYTNRKILCPPETTWGEVQKNKSKIQQIYDFSEDGGRSFSSGKKHKIVAIDPSRVHINYKEDGGDKADGVIYVREGVEDVSLDKSRYAQVRIQVGKGHFIKGMAMYKGDLPEGADLVFNTSKSIDDVGGDKLKALKPLERGIDGKIDKDHPFGTVTRPIILDHDTPKERVTSAMNIVYEEGDWEPWSKNLSSQFLSKQSPTLARTQLNRTLADRQREFDEIVALTNPTVKKRALEDFARGTDAAAVHLKAAALHQKQMWHAILPITSMKPTEVYAPNYEHGERVVLIRHPHGGTFEIPELIVNNRHPEARKLLGDAPDVIGIHHSVAQHLSGADFDGDTVIVIPNNQGKVKTTRALEQLKDFDPRSTYKKYDGMEVMTKEVKAHQMGNISNLITDMTIQQASHEEIARAVKHSMVVIDAEKHELNWKQSAIDHNIAQLKRDYQGGANRGAHTLISLAESQERVPHRRPAWESEGGPIDKQTGELRFTPTGKKTRDRKGNEIDKKIMSTKLAEAKDAHDLSSGTPMEKLYADHSNTLKSLANKARLEMIRTPNLVRSPSAVKAYAKEVDSLNSKLALAIANRPLERQAIQVANAITKVKQQANPNLDGDGVRKVRFQALAEARTRLKADQTVIKITDEEWNAIQAGAISDNKLGQILAKADKKRVRELATPRKPRLMTPAKTQQAKALLDQGYNRAEVAQRLGVSLTTLDTSTSGE